MKESTKKLLWIGLTVMTIKGFFQLEFYSSGAVFGQIVDAETGEYLEGVAVEAQWKEQRGSGAERNNTKLLQQLTTVTGKDGSYRFPEWGSKPEFGFGIIVDNYGSYRPTLNFTKEGYEKKILNCYSFHYGVISVRMKPSCEGYRECCGKEKIKLYKNKN